MTRYKETIRRSVLGAAVACLSLGIAAAPSFAVTGELQASAATTAAPAPADGPLQASTGSAVFGPAAPQRGIAAETWAACGINDDMHKLVREFSRAAGDGFPAGIAQLECGTENYGYRHILAGHQQDWANVAALIGSDWRSLPTG